MNKKMDERRRFTRIPIAADIGEPVEIKITTGKPAKVKPKILPAILANLSAGGMALIAFGEKETFIPNQKVQLVANLPGMAHARIEGRIIHIRSRMEMHTLGVRFVSIAAVVRRRIQNIVSDYDDCETRISLGIPEVCTGSTCHYFGLCKKTQKTEPIKP